MGTPGKWFKKESNLTIVLLNQPADQTGKGAHNIPNQARNGTRMTLIGPDQSRFFACIRPDPPDPLNPRSIARQIWNC
jgi:hypothetical protein